MTTRDTVLVALFAAIIVAMGFIPPITIGIVPVPITLQTLGVMLAGAVLGPVRGALAPCLVVALVALGLPVLSGGRGGFGVFAGPTAGFLFGWVPGAFVTGLIVKRRAVGAPAPLRDLLVAMLACAVGGIAVVYLVGVVWLGLVTGIGLTKALLGTLAFLPGDIIKAVVAALVTRSVRRAYPIELK